MPSINVLPGDAVAVLPITIAILTAKVSIVLAIAGLVTRLAPRVPAATRHALWTLALGSALVVPIVQGLAPAWRLAWIPAMAPNPSSAAVAAPPAGLVVTMPSRPATAAVPSHIDRGASAVLSASTPSRDVRGPATSILAAVRRMPAWTLGLVWLVGVALMALRWIVALARLARLERTSPRVTDPAWLDLLASCARRLGLRRTIALRTNVEATVPMTWGIRRPVILLPAATLHWSHERRRMVLLHELAHVRRHDALTIALARFVTTLHWFNPIVPAAARQLRREAEMACDDLVLGASTRASAYASDLLDIAQGIEHDDRLPSAALAMARRSQLEGRLLAILDSGRRRGGMGRASLACSAVLAILLTAGLGAARGAARDVGPSRAPRARTVAPVARVAPTARTAPVAAAPRAAAVASPAPVAPVATVAPARRDHTSMSINDHDGRTSWNGNWNNDHSNGKVRVDGQITFSRDATDIERVGEGGVFDLEVTTGGHTRRIVMRNRHGTTERQYDVDGHPAPWDAAAHAWLAQALLDFDRSTGAMIDRRFPLVMKQGGVPAVLNEIGLLASDYTRGLWFDRLLETPIDAPTMRLIVGTAGKSMTSDYELGRLLAKTVDRNVLRDPSVHADFLAAADRLQSDYEHGRILMMIVERPDLTPAERGVALRSAVKLESDYERGRVLMALAEHPGLDDDLVRLYLDAAAAISSDYERGRSLASLVEHQRLGPASVKAVVRASASLTSDHERANLLVDLIEHVTLDREARDAYRAAARGIGSSYDRDRALAALGNTTAGE